MRLTVKFGKKIISKVMLYEYSSGSEMLLLVWMVVLFFRSLFSPTLPLTQPFSLALFTHVELCITCSHLLYIMKLFSIVLFIQAPIFLSPFVLSFSQANPSLFTIIIDTIIITNLDYLMVQ